jgi:hypothetical protein
VKPTPLFSAVSHFRQNKVSEKKSKDMLVALSEGRSRENVEVVKGFLPGITFWESP